MELLAAKVGGLSADRLQKPIVRLPRSAFRRGLDRRLHSVKWAALLWLFKREIVAVRAAFSVEPLARILVAYPDISLKPVRPYLVGSLKRQHRSSAVIGHYTAAARIMTAEAFVESHTNSVRLMALPTNAGEITVNLTGQEGLYREAEWRLVLNLDGSAAIEMGLAIVDKRMLGLVGDGAVLWIGVLKVAVAGKRGLEVSRALTKAADGLRPKALLLLVAQTLARAFKLAGVFAASNKGHVFAGDYSLRHRIKADYDSFWEESGGVRVNPSMFCLPPTKMQRDPNEYKPNKRAQIRRRQILEREIEKRVLEAVALLICRE